VRRKLGEGGSASVFEARDEARASNVALKVIRQRKFKHYGDNEVMVSADIHKNGESQRQCCGRV
jgi:hypothetical protein